RKARRQPAPVLLHPPGANDPIRAGSRQMRMAMPVSTNLRPHRPFRDLAARPGPPERPSAADADPVRRARAGAIVQVLRGAARPLSALDLLVELGHRYRGWTSGLARHTLAELVHRGIVAERRDLRPCSYALAAGQAPAHRR